MPAAAIKGGSLRGRCGALVAAVGGKLLSFCSLVVLLVLLLCFFVKREIKERENAVFERFGIIASEMEEEKPSRFFLLVEGRG